MELKKLYVDIEVTPNEGYFWECGKQWVGPDQISRERNIIMIQYAWEGAKSYKDVEVLKWGPGDWKKWDDRDYTILKEFSKVCQDEAIKEIVTKNGIAFDKRWILARLAVLGLPPLPPMKHIDLQVISNKYMRFNSSGLSYLNKLFGGTGKKKMEYNDWIKVLKGDEKALLKMEKYGKKDILDTIKLEKCIIPYIPELVSRGRLKVSNNLCPACGGKLQKRGWMYTTVGRRQRYSCCNIKHPKDKPIFYVSTSLEYF